MPGDRPCECPRLGNCGDFALSLVSDTGGQSSPVAAAKWFAVHGGMDVPRSGWHETARDENGATVKTSDSTLHAVQGRDGTWQIDSGSC